MAGIYRRPQLGETHLSDYAARSGANRHFTNTHRASGYVGIRVSAQQHVLMTFPRCGKHHVHTQRDCCYISIDGRTVN
jgi:hypothetical protein